MLRPPLELFVEARIADHRQRALSSRPRNPRRPRGVRVWNRHNRSRGHVALAPAYGRFATTNRC